MPSLLLLCILPLLPRKATAWGQLGHQTVAYVAQNFVQSSTATWAQGILGDTSSSYMANVATWADTFRYTSAGSYSEPYHFIDAHDSPPTSCGVDYSRDCGTGGCVVSAIQNYTQRVQDGRLSAEHTMEALEFLIHFFGDVTQPLHDENYEVGGNDIAVTFDGASNNLHAVWDTAIPEKLRGGYGLGVAQSWANDLTAAITSGSYSSQKESWLSGMKLSDPVSSAMLWAVDANQYVCSASLKNGTSYVENNDLGGTYYQAVNPVVSLQLAKAGYRLAAWLNLIVNGATGL